VPNVKSPMDMPGHGGRGDLKLLARTTSESFYGDRPLNIFVFRPLSSAPLHCLDHDQEGCTVLSVHLYSMSLSTK